LDTSLFPRRGGGIRGRYERGAEEYRVESPAADCYGGVWGGGFVDGCAGGGVVYVRIERELFWETGMESFLGGHGWDIDADYFVCSLYGLGVGEYHGGYCWKAVEG